MSFEEYLHSKKIDSKAFERAEGNLYKELELLFNQIHPDSFTGQKLFLLNPLRRKYNWKEETESPKPKAEMKPKIAKPKI